MIRNQTEQNRITNDMEDVWIMNFPVSKQKSLVLKEQQSMKNLTIGINALNGVSMLELNGLEALEKVVIMRGGLSGGTGRLRITNCTSLNRITIGEEAFIRYKYLELVDLPRLRTINIGSNGFMNIKSIQMDSNSKD